VGYQAGLTENSWKENGFCAVEIETLQGTRSLLKVENTFKQLHQSKGALFERGVMSIFISLW